MANSTGQALAICPYYVAEGRTGITCEDCRRAFADDAEKAEWTGKYCYTWSYGSCPYAAELTKMYERIEGGAEVERTELEQQVKSLSREVNHKNSLIGKQKKRMLRMQKKIDDLRAVNESYMRVNDSLEKQKTRYYRKARVAEEQLAAKNDRLYEEITKLTQIYEQRLVYLIDRYCPAGLPESEVKAWAEGREIAITGEYDEESGLVWHAKWRYASEDDETEDEGTGAAEAHLN